jgi:[acyl-carrier-protein] S-malonyltransferase
LRNQTINHGGSLGLADNVVEEFVLLCRRCGLQQTTTAGTISNLRRNIGCRSGLCCDERGGRKTCFVTTVGGAFSLIMMEPAREELAAAIEATTFSTNLSGISKRDCKCVSNPEIKKNLIIQLTAPVKWTQSVQQMITDGATLFTELAQEKISWINWKIDKTATANA